MSKSQNEEFISEALSPLMDKSRIKRKRKRRGASVIVSAFILVAAIVGAYFALDHYNIANAQQLLMMSGAVGDVTATPTTVINTLVPDDMSAYFDKAELETTQQPQALLAEATPIVTPQPTPHPGVRDDVFTDGEIISDDMSYHSKDLSVEISVVEKGESVAYVAEVYFRSLDNFMPVFAGGKYHGGYSTTTDMAKEYDAVFAVNSDSCTATDYGIIVRYGETYRDNLAADHLVIFDNGLLQTYMPRNISAESLVKKGAVHVFNFGPLLLNNGKAIDKFMYSHIRDANPRTAVGMVEPYHYFFVVVDGRAEYSKGMTMEELSSFMAQLGCVDAYNLDGGGSSTMVFKGELINKPEGTTNQREIDSAILFVENP